MGQAGTVVQPGLQVSRKSRKMLANATTQREAGCIARPKIARSGSDCAVESTLLCRQTTSLRRLYVWVRVGTAWPSMLGALLR